MARSTGGNRDASGSRTRSPADWLLQTIELAQAAKEIGIDGAFARVRHFERQLASPFPLLSAIAARTSRIEIGTAVIDMRYEIRNWWLGSQTPVLMGLRCASVTESLAACVFGISRCSGQHIAIMHDMFPKHIRHLLASRVSVLAASTVALVAIVTSPFALQAIASIFNLNWIKLSNVGQAYGAVSALIAGLALCGVAASVFLQARETRYNRWAAERSRHFELMRIAMEDPFYRQVFALPDMSEDMARLTGYINLLFYHWSLVWEFGDIPEAVLRGYLADILHSKVGRAYWQIYRDTLLKTEGAGRQSDFYQIVDMIYRESISLNVDATSDTNNAQPDSRNLREIMIALGVGLICGALSDRLLHAKRKKAI